MYNDAPVFPEPPVFEAVTRYGSVDESADETFTDVMSLAVTPDGRVFAYDLDRGIRWFHRSGEFGGWLARDGAGPSEVGYAPLLAASPSGLIAVGALHDPRHATGARLG